MSVKIPTVQQESSSGRRELRVPAERAKQLRTRGRSEKEIARILEQDGFTSEEIRLGMQVGLGSYGGDLTIEREQRFQRSNPSAGVTLKEGDQYEFEIIQKQMNRGIGWVHGIPVFVPEGKIGERILARITKPHPGNPPTGLDRSKQITDTELVSRQIHFAEAEVVTKFIATPQPVPPAIVTAKAPLEPPKTSLPAQGAQPMQREDFGGRPTPQPGAASQSFTSQSVQNQTVSSPQVLSQSTLNKSARYLAIIGPSQSGKTVFASLIYHELVNSQKNLRVKDVLVEEGSLYLESTLGTLRQGKFPEPTGVTQRVSPIIINVEFEVGWRRTKKIRLYLGDFSGEYVDGQPPSGQNLVKAPDPLQFLRTEAGGTLAFMVDASAYILIVDATSDLNRLAFVYNELLIKLAQAKTGKRSAKLEDPIAVLVSKWDRLQQAERTQNASEFVARRMPYFVSQAHAISKNPIQYYRVEVATRKRDDGVNVPIVDSGNLGVWGATNVIKWVKEVL